MYQKYFVIKICSYLVNGPLGFLKVIYYLVSVLLDIIFSFFFLFKKEKSLKQEPKKILIIKIDQLGDVLLSTTLITAIKKKYPDAVIDYVIQESSLPVLKDNKGVSSIYTYYDISLLLRALLSGRKKLHTSIWKIFKENIGTLKALRNNEYDVVINTCHSPPSSNILWKLIKPEVLISFDVSQRNFLADITVPYDIYNEEWKNLHKLLLPLGIKEEVLGPHFFNIAESVGTIVDTYIVITPTTFGNNRGWGTDKWRTLVKEISKSGIHVYLAGVKNQEEDLNMIARDINNVSVLTQLSTPELARLLLDAQYVIGIESFPTHLSITLKKQTYCIIDCKNFYLPTYSKKGLVRFKSMIPLVPHVTICDIRSNTVDDIIKKIHENSSNK